MMTTQPKTSEHSTTDTGATRTAAAFGAAAAITVLFNVVLAFVKDAYPPLNTFMVHLTGHHWVTHGLADIVVFILLGWLFTIRGIPARGLTPALVTALGVAVVVAGVALGGWFILV